MNGRELSNKVFEMISDTLRIGVDELNLDSHLVDELGADSIDIVELTMEFELEFNIEISDEDFSKIKTVGDVINYLQERTK